MDRVTQPANLPRPNGTTEMAWNFFAESNQFGTIVVVHQHFLKNNNETVKFLNKTNKKENDRTNQFSGYGRPVAAVTGLRNPVIEMDSSASQWSHPFWLRNPTDPEQIYIIDFIKFKHNNKKKPECAIKITRGNKYIYTHTHTGNNNNKKKILNNK